MRLLAIDIGTSMGLAEWTDYNTGCMCALTADLLRDIPKAHSKVQELRDAFRINSFIHQMDSGFLEQHTRLDAIYYERVMRHTGTIAAHVYGGLYGALCVWAQNNGVRLVGVTPTEIKLWATGKKGAGKDDMVRACKRIWDVIPDSDDMADALCLLDYARNKEMLFNKNA